MEKRNKTIDLSKFNKMLTGWTKKDNLRILAEDFIKENAEAYGVDFVIKQNNVTKQHAIFINEDNRLRRKDDIELLTTVGDELLTKMRFKREGVSMFKTYFMTR